MLSLRAYALYRKDAGLPGGTLRAVQKAVKAGRIHLVDGKIDPDQADTAWQSNTNPTKQANAQAQQRASADEQQPTISRPVVVTSAASASPGPIAIPGPAPVEAVDAAEAERPEIPQEESYSEACRREKWIAVREREFKMRKLDGELVELVAVNSFVAGMIIRVRDALCHLPAELRDRLAQETDPVEIERILGAQFEQILRGMSEYRRAA